MTGDTVPWKEYFAPPPLNAVFVIVPIKRPFAALNKVIPGSSGDGHIRIPAGGVVIGTVFTVPSLWLSVPASKVTVAFVFGTFTSR